MIEKETIFLTADQALEAICFDFRQYSQQILLFSEIIRLISAGKTIIRKDTQRNGIWISMPGSKNMRWMAGPELVNYLCSALLSARLDAGSLAPICARVFQTRAFPETDHATGQKGIRIETGMEDFWCRQCGYCCQHLDFHNEVYDKDVDRWKRLRRRDILEWVGVSKNPAGTVTYQIWMKPGSRQLAEQCPFIEKRHHENRWMCKIHHVKPAICRNYPVSRKHALMTGCPGFEKRH